MQEIGDDDEEAKWLGYIERATISEVLAQYIIYCRHTSPTLVTPELEAAAGTSQVQLWPLKAMYTSCLSICF